MNACTLVLHHNQKFNIVKDEAETPVNRTETQVVDGEEVEVEVRDKVILDGQQYDALGSYTVLTQEGEQERHKILMDDPDPESVTTIQIPEGYEDTPTSLTHLTEMLLDRHAPGEAVVGVSSPDNAPFARRIAALMGVDYLTKKEASA